MFRVIAIIAAYNEERFIKNCIENFISQEVEVYLINNGSDDRTAEIAKEYLGKGLIGIEDFPREDFYYIEKIWNKKTEIASELNADWFIHSDADEIRITGDPRKNLKEKLLEIDQQGYNAVDYHEFTFIPTLESPNHDHENYMETMKWYYHFLPRVPHSLNTWKKQAEKIKLTSHKVDFPGLKMYPESFQMKHYFYLSREHAVRKWCSRKYAPNVLKRGLHRRRAGLKPDNINFISRDLLYEYTSDNELNAVNPRKVHYLFENV